MARAGTEPQSLRERKPSLLSERLERIDGTEWFVWWDNITVLMNRTGLVGGKTRQSVMMSHHVGGDTGECQEYWNGRIG